ncbi:MAG: aminotransferase class IV [Acidimicrobiia bacterium]
MTRKAPLKAMLGTVMINGELIPAERAAISVLDRGFLWGDGVYEIIPSFNGRLFRLSDHLERLQASLSYVQIRLPMSTNELATRTDELMRANADVVSTYPVCRVGHWISRGLEDWGRIYERTHDATLVSLVCPVRNHLTKADYESGLLMTLVSTRRSSPAVLDPRAKTTSKMNLIIADVEAGFRRSLPVMLDQRGFIAESSTSNIFIVKDGRVLTPQAEWVLGGITRKVVIELTLEAGIEVSEKDLTVIDAASADEIFVTSSTWGVVPVRAIDQIKPRLGTDGPVVRLLIDKLATVTGFHPMDQAH